MGNSNSTRKTPRAPTSVDNFHRDVYNTPAEYSIPPVSFNSPTFISPLVSTNENAFDIPPISTTSPAFTIPEISPESTNPITSPVPVTRMLSSSTVIPIEVPTAVILNEHPIATSLIDSSTPEIPIVSPTPQVPIPSAIAIVPANSPIPPAPESSWSPYTPIVYPATADTNDFLVISPDISGVSPTLDLPSTPIASPLPTDAVIPLQSIVSSDETHSTTPVTHDISTSPMARLIPKTTRPTEVTREPSVSKDFTVPSAPNVTPVKHITLSSADRSIIWNQFEQKQHQKQKRSGLPTLPTENLSKSSVPPSQTSKTDLVITPITPAIVAVPSFSLRSTAVRYPSEDHQILSERTQSIYTDLSIFKYHLTYNEAKYTGDHTKATMFQMDTHRKQTPLPTPSLSLVTKNFSDGSHRTEQNVPSFGSLDPQHGGHESEPIDQSQTVLHLHAKQRQENHRQSPSYTKSPPGSNNSLQHTTSTVFSQTHFTTPNDRQLLTKIRKKPASQLHTNPISTETNNKFFPKFQINDIESSPSIVSPTLPSSFRTKATQSISRSENLIHRKKLPPFQN